jgi:hypothetical protein
MGRSQIVNTRRPRRYLRILLYFAGTYCSLKISLKIYLSRFIPEGNNRTRPGKRWLFKETIPTTLTHTPHLLCSQDQQ